MHPLVNSRDGYDVLLYSLALWLITTVISILVSEKKVIRFQTIKILWFSFCLSWSERKSSSLESRNYNSSELDSFSQRPEIFWGLKNNNTLHLRAIFFLALSKNPAGNTESFKQVCKWTSMSWGLKKNIAITNQNKQHSSIFFSNPQLLVKKTMKSYVSWEVKKIICRIVECRILWNKSFYFFSSFHHQYVDTDHSTILHMIYLLSMRRLIS